MNKLWGGIGTLFFWLLWPVWVVYFKANPRRSRVMVVVQDELLLVQGWLGVKEFSLPGGGWKKNETAAAAAVRELREETGIEAYSSNLRIIGSRSNASRGLRYKASLFVLQLPEKPIIKKAKYEIFNAAWISLEDADGYNLDDDARYALKRYLPPEQASLL